MPDLNWWQDSVPVRNCDVDMLRLTAAFEWDGGFLGYYCKSCKGKWDHEGILVADWETYEDRRHNVLNTERKQEE